MAIKISHDEYLKRVLHSNKIVLDNLNIENRIRLAEYNVKKELIQAQIDSIEIQLEDRE